MNYDETLHYLFSALPMFHRVGPAAYKANLDNTYALCNLLGNPEKNLICIHVAGTNGKGSVSHMLAAIFQEAGFKTGLYTSPHLRDFRERIRVNGEMVSKEWICDFVTKYKNNFDELLPSFFEMSTAMAFAYFRDVKTEIAIIETGLGGRLDSTNVVTPLISVITNIGFDHTNLLGNTFEKIAGEKAGIIKKNIPVVIGESAEATNFVFINKANDEQSTIIFADQHYKVIAENYNPVEEKMHVTIYRDEKLYIENLLLDLTGLYQLKNCCTVLQTLELLNDSKFLTSEHIVREALGNVKKMTHLEGRWQLIGKNPTIICDTGHNEAGLRTTIPLLNEIPHQQLHIVLGVVDDKELSGTLSFFPEKAIYYFCKADIPRGLDATILAAKAGDFNLKGGIYATVRSALAAAQLAAGVDDLIFVGGSTFTVAEVV